MTPPKEVKSQSTKQPFPSPSLESQKCPAKEILPKKPLTAKEKKHRHKRKPNKQCMQKGESSHKCFTKASQSPRYRMCIFPPDFRLQSIDPCRHARNPSFFMVSHAPFLGKNVDDPTPARRARSVRRSASPNDSLNYCRLLFFMSLTHAD